MPNELPDLDENVSFVVDSGAPVGPIAMRSIINSIRSGERAPDVLVWWAGAADWVPFSSSTGLSSLLSDLPATEQPPPPSDVDVDAELTGAVDELESQIPDDSPAHLATTVIDMGMVEQAQALADEADDADEAVEPDEADAADAADPYEVVVDAAFEDVDDADGLEEKFPEPEVITFGLVDDPDDGDELVEEAAQDVEVVEDSVEAVESVEDAVEDVEDVTSEDDIDEEGAGEAENLDVDADVDADEAVDVEEDVEDEIELLVEDDVVAQDQFTDAAEAEADALLAREPRDMHPSAGWGDDSTDEASDDHAVDDHAVDEDVVEDLPIDEPEVVSAGGLTGLFGSPVSEELDEADVDDVEDDGDSSRATLETVGARIDALSSATSRSRPFGGAEEPSRESFAEDGDLEGEADVETAAENGWVDGDAEAPDETDDQVEAPAEVEQLAKPTAGSWQAVDEDPDLDDRFAQMVEVSNAHQRRLDWVMRVDELLMDACVRAIVDRGFVLLDLDGLDLGQRAVFDRHGDSQHIRLSLEPLSPVIAGDPIDRHVKVTMSWGRDVADADAAFATLRAEATDEEASPGHFTSDVNMVSSSATTSVDLIWLARDFVAGDHAVDQPEIDTAISAILHALERRWYELFSAAD